MANPPPTSYILYKLFVKVPTRYNRPKYILYVNPGHARKQTNNWKIIQDKHVHRTHFPYPVLYTFWTTASSVKICKCRRDGDTTQMNKKIKLVTVRQLCLGQDYTDTELTFSFKLNLVLLCQRHQTVYSPGNPKSLLLQKSHAVR